MRVYLRAFELDDYQHIYKWNHDDHITEQTAGNKYFYSSGRVRKWVEAKIEGNIKELYYAICLSDTNQMIGYMSLNEINLINRNALWGGIVIGETDCRNIVNTVQAIFLMLDYGFNELNLHKISGRWLDKNKKSLMLGDIFNFQHEGVLRNEVFKRGKYHDVIVKSLLRDEYMQIRANLIRDFNIT